MHENVEYKQCNILDLKTLTARPRKANFKFYVRLRQAYKVPYGI
jgi:hypothetical protein